ncbi:MAG TPA: sugar ABC transporter permease, partial [Magnetospirillaceae bacterium]
SLLGGSHFVGLKNYVKAFSDDPVFWQALLFTAKYTLFITPILMGLGFVFALLTAAATPLARLARTAIFLPFVIGLASSSLLWFWLLDEQVGLVNRLLMDLGIIAHPIVWWIDPSVGLWGVILSVVWKVVGFGTIIFVAAIQAIDPEMIDAAMIDGAGYWQRVRRILLPLSARSILLTTLVSAIGSMLAFDQFYIMTGGGPEGHTFTSVYWMYQNSFSFFKLGYGSALALILVAIIFVGAVAQMALTRRSAAR